MAPNLFILQKLRSTYYAALIRIALYEAYLPHLA